MATISVDTLPSGNDRCTVATWANMAQNDVGMPMGNSQYTDRSFQVAGTFGGATVAVEGTNDDTNWSTLTDLQGNPLLFTTAKIELVTEATLRIRPKVTGGDGTTNLTVSALLKE